MQGRDLQDRGEGLEGVVRRLAIVGVIAGGTLLLGVSGLIIVEIALRKFFESSIQGVDEISSYAMALSFAWAMPFAILDRVHIRIDVLHMVFPQRLRAWLDFGAMVIFTFYLAILSYFCLRLALASYEDGTRSYGLLGWPLAGPQAAWAAGLTAAFATTIYLTVKTARALMMKKYMTVTRLIGTKTFSAEEAENAKREATERQARE